MQRPRSVLSLLSAAVLLVLSVHGQSDALEVTITFDGVAVSGLETDLISNRVLHLRESTEPSDAVPPAPEGSIGFPGTVPNPNAPRGAATTPYGTATTPYGAATAPPGTATAPPGAAAGSQGTPRSPQGAATSRQSGATAPQTGGRTPEAAPKVLPAISGRLVPPPGAGFFNPSFIEHGFVVESFWAVNTGDPNGYFVRGHFHPKNLETGFEAQHFGGPRELHGLFIRAVDGRPFSLKSLAYRVTRNRELGRSQSITGFSNHNVKILITTDFSAKRSVLGQFIQFAVGPQISNDTTLPFQTLAIEGFVSVSQVFIASSASVDFDNIVIDVDE